MAGHLETEQKNQADTLQNVWREMLGTEAGRLILWSILDTCGIAKVGAGMFPVLTPDGQNVLLGRQQVGGELLDDFVHDNDRAAYNQMLIEADNRAERLRIAAGQDEEDED